MKDLGAELRQIAERIKSTKENVKTEEATKQTYILPFLSALGYDIFDPSIVVPEFTADVGNKQGEKVDYALMRDGEPIILIEAKHHNAKLDNHTNQLVRYFTVTKSKFGVLTNGVEYRFFTDLNEKNKMDGEPFFVINLENLKEKHIKELEQFAKDLLNVEQILSSAGRKKYIAEIQTAVKGELAEPSIEFVKLLARKLYPNKTLTANFTEDFRQLSKVAFADIINELAEDKINSIQSGFKAQITSQQELQETMSAEEEQKTAIETTEIEMDGYYIVRSILAEKYPVADITYKDTLNYFTITYKNRVTKWICRMYLNSKNKYIEFPNAANGRVQINNIEELYGFKKELLDAMASVSE